MTADRWACMVLGLAHEPLPAVPALPGRRHECHDRGVEDAADMHGATDPATRRQRAAATRCHHRELWLLHFAQGAGQARERA